MDTDLNYQSNYLFVYGSLLGNNNEFGIYLKNNSQFLAEGRFKGVLYDLGQYPGAVYKPGAETHVYGSVFILSGTVKVLGLLDAYEGFGEHEDQPNLFVRELIEVEKEAEVIRCWVYLYNLPVNGLRQIVTGRYFK